MNSCSWDTRHFSARLRRWSDIQSPNLCASDTLLFHDSIVLTADIVWIRYGLVLPMLPECEHPNTLARFVIAIVMDPSRISALQALGHKV
jgi:hypothetical protein